MNHLPPEDIFPEQEHTHISLTRDQLAAFTHEVWANWMKHLIPKIVNRKVENSDIERWGKQIITPFEDLSEEEKESDRKVVEKVLNKIL